LFLPKNNKALVGMAKKRILVYWDYRRKDLLLPFEKLAGDFEWYFIFFRYRQDDPVPAMDNRLYWGDYKNPYQLLNKIKPGAVIFSDLSNVYSIALNVASKNRAIPTYLLEHGVKLKYDYYVQMEASVQDQLKAKGIPLRNSRYLDKLHTLRFYFSAVKAANLPDLINLVRVFYAAFALQSDRAFSRYKFKLRCTDKYLLFSRQNFTYYQYRDGIKEEDVIYFGNPYQDDYLKALLQSGPSNGKPYYLLLDDGNVESFGITVNQKNDFIRKLNEFALGREAILVVKLHPMDYGRTDLYRHQNIKYVEAADLARLIHGASGCFAISTTLMFPLIAEGKIIVFRVKESKIQDVLASYGIRFLDYIHFHPSEIDFSRFRLSPEVAEDFIENFMYKYDGESTVRLKRILEEPE